MKQIGTSLIAVVLAGLISLAAPGLCAAQALPASEREALVRLRLAQGGRAEEVDGLIRLADEAAAKGLPSGPLVNKIREGLAKGVAPQRIEPVIRQIATHLETADRLVRDTDPATGGPARDTVVALLADSIGGGLTPDDIRALQRAAQPAAGSGTPPISAESLAGAARGLAFIKDAGLSVSEGTVVMAEAVRRGFRPSDSVDVGREVKRREADYRTGRARLLALRDAIARGDRPDQLLRDSRGETMMRPEPEKPVERPTRPERSRPDPVRPERPAATGRGR